MTHIERSSAGLFLPILACIICFAVFSSGCAKTATGPSLEPQSFRISKSLSGGVMNTLTPKEKGKVFLVVSVAIPAKELMPTDAEYATIKSRIAENAKKDSRQVSNIPRQEDCRIYKPDRFTVIVADGRGFRGDLMSNSIGFSAQSTMWRTTADKNPPPPPKQETLEVAFVMNEKDIVPPLKIQLDKNPPVAVPVKQAE